MIRFLIPVGLVALALSAVSREASAQRHFSGYGSYNIDKPPAPGEPRSPSEVKLRKVRSEDYDSYDEYKVAQLGPDWAKMVHPRDGDPYPACKEWKTWTNQFGIRVSGWDWAEMNCPWRQWKDYEEESR